MPNTFYSIVATRLSKQSSQVAEDHRLLLERVDAQQHDNEALHRELAAFKVFITQTLSQAPPLPPPPSPLSSPTDDVEDLRMDYVHYFFYNFFLLMYAIRKMYSF